MRIIGLDIHRAFAEAVAWKDGKLSRLGRVIMRRQPLEELCLGRGKHARLASRRTSTDRSNRLLLVLGTACHWSARSKSRSLAGNRRGT